MKLSRNWLAEYVDLTGVTDEELAFRLTKAGLAVDAVEPRNQGVSGVKVGYVSECEKHPNADKLRVCQIDVGNEDLLTIVCGAPNVQAGQKVAVALPGASLPGGMKIGKAKLRGIESSGMLCSAKELGLEVRLLPSHQTEGLYILPEDAIVGDEVTGLLGLDDVVFDVDLTPNRSDCLSIRGFAYEVAALLGQATKFPKAVTLSSESNVTASEQNEAALSIRIETPFCTLYDAQVVNGVVANASPLWMQNRLMASGVRPIDVIVDVTNYVMLEWGQPLHAFDFGSVENETIVVRQAVNDEVIVTLDGERRQLDEAMTVIADPLKAIGIAGVMGGQNSEVTQQTSKIIIESAAFDAVATRRTGQRLGLRSEAQQRFEKGIDRSAVRSALCRATSLLQELTGAEPQGEIISAGHVAQGTSSTTSCTIQFSPLRCNACLGTAILPEKMAEIFHLLGFSTVEGSVEWQVMVPSRRPDIQIEEDLFEEIGRVFGLDSIPSTLPEGPTTAGVRNTQQAMRKRTREILSGTGMTEVFTYAFTHPDKLRSLRLPADSQFHQTIPLARPMSDDRTVLRTHLLPSLAEVAEHNLAHGVLGGEIFEIGRVYLPKSLPLTEQPHELEKWAGLWFGARDGQFGEKSRSYDFYDAKGQIEVWLESVGIRSDIRFVPSKATYLHPGVSADIFVEGEQVGVVGELHPETIRLLDIGHAIYAEMDLAVVSGLAKPRFLVNPLPKFPSSRRDIALIVEKTVSSGDLIDSVKATSSDQELLQQVFAFDVYEGIGVPEGKKSIALALVFQALERTLTDEEITPLVQRILDALASKWDAKLRS